MDNLKNLVKSLSRKERIRVLSVIRERAMRNIDLSRELGIRKERVSESLNDLISNHLALRFVKGALEKERHAFYVGTPLSDEISNLNNRLDKVGSLLPTKINNFGEGISYLLSFYLESPITVTYKTIKSRSGKRIKLAIDLEKCDKQDNCEIVCEPIVRALISKFGIVNELERDNCTFKIDLLFKP